MKGYSLLFIYDVRKDLPMMKITEALKARRSYYAINRELPVAIDRVMDMVKELTELVYVYKRQVRKNPLWICL